MTLALRAHHLLCLLTYAGTGYSAAFVRNFDAVAERIAAGEGVALAAGPDAICAPVCADEGDGAHCHCASVSMRDERAAQALAPLLGPPGPSGGWQLDAPLLARLRVAFADGRLRGACVDCQWADLCTQVARQGYAGVRVPALST